MKATTSKPAASKTATKETKKAATETKATAVLNEASVTIIADDKQTVETSFFVDHNLIAQTAYFLWQTEGCQIGLDEEYWLRAEASLQPKK